MKNKIISISDKQLEILLAENFLNSNFESAQNLQLANAVANDILRKKGFWQTIKKIAGLKQLSIIVILAVIPSVFLFTNEEKLFSAQIFKKPTFLASNLNFHSPITTSVSVHPIVEPKKISVEKTEMPEIKLLVSQSSDSAQHTVTISENKKETQDIAFQFPVLTEDEIKANHKQKRKMIHALSKASKSQYAHIPMGTCEYMGKKVSVNEFYMLKTEVSNLEFRTFLFDLLIQNRKEEFLKAKPDQKKWTTTFDWNFNEPMSKNYFSHPAYNDYPVVNVSAEAAEMYCKWLTVETNKSLQEDNKSLINDVRIPHEYEWALAASSKQNKTKYANGKDTLIINDQYQANYGGISKTETYYSPERDVYFPKSAGFSNKNESALTKMSNDGALQTWVVVGYPPNEYGIYNLAGNVAELVVRTYKGDKQYSVKGGSWFSSDYFLMIDADDEFKNPEEPSPLKGFRVVVTSTAKKRKVPF